MKILAIDVGYYATKGIAKDNNVHYPSVIGSPDISLLTANGMSEIEANITLSSGDTFLIGESAVQKSRMIDRKEGREWITTRTWKVLFYYALSQLLPEGGEAHVVTGLPASYFVHDHKQLKEMIDGEHEFETNGSNKLSYNLTSTVTMQPFGSVCNMILDYDGEFEDPKLAQATIGVIDIGGKTTNILTVERMADIEAKTFSVDKGGWDVIRGVRENIASRYMDAELRDHQVAKVVSSKILRRFGNPEDVSDLVDPVIEMMTRDVIAMTTHAWGNGSGLDKIIITGGGANLIGSSIAERFPNAGVISNPAYANVEGYYKYGILLEKLGRIP